MDNLSMRYVFDRKNQASKTKKALLQIEVRITDRYLDKKVYQNRYTSIRESIL